MERILVAIHALFFMVFECLRLFPYIIISKFHLMKSHASRGLRGVALTEVFSTLKICGFCKRVSHNSFARFMNVSSFSQYHVNLHRSSCLSFLPACPRCHSSPRASLPFTYQKRKRGNIVAPPAMEEIAGDCLDSEASKLQALGPSRWRRSWDDQSCIRAVECEGSVEGGTSDPKRGPKRPRMESSFIREMDEAEDCGAKNGENRGNRDGVGMNVSIANWAEETRLRQNKCPRLMIPETHTTVGTTVYSANAENNHSSSEAEHFRRVGITGEEEFKEMLKKLKKLKWRWGPPIHPLMNDRFIMKSGACLKTAILGKEKFASPEDVMRYVKEALEDGEHRAQENVPQIRPQEDIAGHHVERKRNSSQDIAQVPIADSVVEQDSNQVTHELNRALGALSSSNIPRAMKQRTKEFKEVYDFIYMNVKNRRGGSIYLCGCPGTGKSQTVTNVKNDLLQCAREADITTPEFHAFTGTSFVNPRVMYDSLWRGIMGGKSPPSNVEKTLKDRLKWATPTSPMVVVILDEIDHLMSNSPRVLRKLFEWAYAPKSRLLIVGIGNFLNFDVGLLGSKIKMERVSFSAYTPDELVQILAERVSGVVEPAAINLCAKKVASTHGDARRAITVCREAVNIAKEGIQVAAKTGAPIMKESGMTLLVKISHMAKALKIGNSSRFEVTIAELSVQAQIVLCVAATSLALEGTDGEHHSDGSKPGNYTKLTQGSLYNKCLSVWKKLRTGMGLSHVEFSGTVDVLVAQGLLHVRGKQIAGGRSRQLALQIEWHDLATALGDQPFFKTAVER